MNRYEMHLNTVEIRNKEMVKDLEDLFVSVRRFQRHLHPNADHIVKEYSDYLNKHGAGLKDEDKAERIALFEKGMATEEGTVRIAQALLGIKMQYE